MFCHEIVKLVDVESTTAVVDKRADTVLLRFTFVVVVMVSAFVVMVVVMMFVLIFMLMVMMMVVLLLFHRSFYAANPTCRSGNLLKIKHAGIENLVEVNICVVALDNLRTRLNSLDNLTDTAQLFRCHL